MKISTVEIGSNSQGNSPSLATVLSSLNWGGDSSSYNARCEDAGGAAAGAGAGASSAAPAAGSGTPAAGAGSPPAGQDGSGSSAGTAGNGGAAAADANAENLRTLRTNYETLKPWEAAAKAIKDPTQAVTAYQTHQKMFTSGLEMAKALGYTEDSYKAAFDDDPVDTLSHLRAEHAKANPDAARTEQFRKAAEDAARRATQPLTDQMNKQQTDVAVAKYEGEFNRLLADDKLGFGSDVPAEVKDMMEDMINSLVPDAVLAEIKMTGKVSGVQAAFDQAKSSFLKVINGYNAWQAGKSAGGGGNGSGAGRSFQPNRSAAGNGNGAAKPLTIDDIINSPETTLPGLKAGTYS